MANTTIPPIVADIAPEIPQGDSGPNDARLQRFIGYAQLSIDASVWGVKADLGTAYLTAHLMTRRGGTAAQAAGSLVLEKVGDVTLQYAPPSNDDEYKATPYGKQYLMLRRSVASHPLVP